MKQWKWSLSAAAFGIFCTGLMAFGYTGPEYIKIGLTCVNMFFAGLNTQCAVMWYRDGEQ